MRRAQADYLPEVVARGTAGENWLTELSNDELKRLLTLDRKEALA